MNNGKQVLQQIYVCPLFYASSKLHGGAEWWQANRHDTTCLQDSKCYSFYMPKNSPIYEAQCCHLMNHLQLWNM